MFDTQQLLRDKRDGLTLSEQDIHAFVHGIACHEVSEAQMAAFAMAVSIQGLDHRETVNLCCAMRDSGKKMSWDLPGPVLDKHSTGGVGDMVSLILGPILAACGAYVPMISGRGLGHSGGTIDKLESIPGYNGLLSQQKFRHCVRESGLCIIGQTDELAPADKYLYSTRDTTGTIESIPLITTSILSKKLAEGLDGLVMDIKVGNGAFMKDMKQATKLAESIVNVASHLGVKTHGLITDMNAPLAASAGNGLEILESIAFLKGNTPHPALAEVTLALAAEALLVGNMVEDIPSGRRMAQQALNSGQAAETFQHMLSLCGGPADMLDNSQKHICPAPFIKPLLAEQSGFISDIDTRSIGLSVVHLGGGRQHSGQTIDHRVGLSQIPQPGDRVCQGEALCHIHARSEDEWNMASIEIRESIRLTSQPRPPIQRVVGIIRPTQEETPHGQRHHSGH